MNGCAHSGCALRKVRGCRGVRCGAVARRTAVSFAVSPSASCPSLFRLLCVVCVGCLPAFFCRGRQTAQRHQRRPQLLSSAGAAEEAPDSKSDRPVVQSPSSAVPFARVARSSTSVVVCPFVVCWCLCAAGRLLALSLCSLSCSPPPKPKRRQAGARRRAARNNRRDETANEGRTVLQLPLHRFSPVCLFAILGCSAASFLHRCSLHLSPTCNALGPTRPQQLVSWLVRSCAPQDCYSHHGVACTSHPLALLPLSPLRLAQRKRPLRSPLQQPPSPLQPPLLLLLRFRPSRLRARCVAWW
jgi:hypothetical protein